MDNRNIIIEGEIKKSLKKTDLNEMENFERGLFLLAVEKLYKATDDKDYLNFVVKNIDDMVDENGNVNGQSGKLEDYVTGKVLFFTASDMNTVCEKVKEKSEKAIKKLNTRLFDEKRYNKTERCDGTFSCEIKDMFMTQPFYMNYETKYGGKEHYNDIISQFNNIVENTPFTDKDINENIAQMTMFAASLPDTMEVMEQPLYEIFDRLKRLFKTVVNAVYKNNSKSLENLSEEEKLMFVYAVLKGCRMKLIQTEKYEQNVIDIFNKELQNAEENFDEVSNYKKAAFVMAYSEEIRNREYQDYGRNKGGVLWS